MFSSFGHILKQKNGVFTGEKILNTGKTFLVAYFNIHKLRLCKYVYMTF